MKSDLLDGRMRLNVTLFDMDYQDMQIGTAGQDQFGQAAWVTANDGEANIQGVEIEINSTIGEHWFVDGTFGNTDFQYMRVPTLADCLAKGFPAAVVHGTDRHRQLTRAARRRTRRRSTRAITTNLEQRQRDHASATASAIRTRSSSARTTIRLLRGPSYSLHNARITWVSPDQSWEASLFGTNITDERAMQSKLSFLNLFGTVQTTYVRPEEWALTLKKRF